MMYQVIYIPRIEDEICLPPEILWLEYLYAFDINQPNRMAKNSDIKASVIFT